MLKTGPTYNTSQENNNEASIMNHVMMRHATASIMKTTQTMNDYHGLHVTQSDVITILIRRLLHNIGHNDQGKPVQTAHAWNLHVHAVDTCNTQTMCQCTGQNVLNQDA